ncbi:hypothetical protein [Candidatus Pantoea formicae]|uniref:hypothetical protein n=1 Tax=Candidatus Pantoea formicae TaxID=2608355 RepID=UPI003ED8A675
MMIVKPAVILLSVILAVSFSAHAGFKSSGFKSSGFKSSSRSSSFTRSANTRTTSKSGYQVSGNKLPPKPASTSERTPVKATAGKSLAATKGTIPVTPKKPASSAAITSPSLLSGSSQPSAKLQNVIKQKEGGGFGLTHLAILYLLMRDDSHDMSVSDRAWVEQKIQEEKANGDTENTESPQDLNKPDNDSSSDTSISDGEITDSLFDNADTLVKYIKAMFLILPAGFLLCFLLRYISPR